MSARYLLPPDVVFTDLSGAEGREGILLNVATRRYYSLNETGLAIYERLMAGDRAAQIAEHLTAGYEIDLESATRSVAGLLAALASAGLIREESP